MLLIRQEKSPFFTQQVYRVKRQWRVTSDPSASLRASEWRAVKAGGKGSRGGKGTETRQCWLACNIVTLCRGAGNGARQGGKEARRQGGDRRLRPYAAGCAPFGCFSLPQGKPVMDWGLRKGRLTIAQDWQFVQYQLLIVLCGSVRRASSKTGKFPKWENGTVGRAGMGLWEQRLDLASASRARAHLPPGLGACYTLGYGS